MKSFKDWIEEDKDYRQQTSSANYPMHPIRKPEDLYHASKGDNFETVSFDAIRHNARQDAKDVAKSGDAKKISDNKKMQHAGEMKLDLTKKLDRIYAGSSHPDAVKTAIKDHNKKHGTNFKDLKDALAHGESMEKQNA